MGQTKRSEILDTQRVVIKIGTRVLTHDDGRLALSRLYDVVEAVGALCHEGREALLVSSGAVGLGRHQLGFDAVPRELHERQACAAVGQSRLMALYEAGFRQLGLRVGQVLLTEADFADRERYLNLRGALLALLRHRVVPIINENDVVATDELAYLGEQDGHPVFGDNDRLSALVASKLEADLLVLLTDVDGIYDRDPTLHPEARLLSQLTVDAAAWPVKPGTSRSGAGRGGMRSKLEAALLAARSGCQVVVTSGRQPGLLRRVLKGEPVGTWIPAAGGLSARRRWLAWATAPKGTLHLDQGAVTALQERGASLLAAGVVRLEGRFAPGDVVLLAGPDGTPVGRGIIGCDAETARHWMAGTPPAYARNHHALVHRDHLVLEGDSA